MFKALGFGKSKAHEPASEPEIQSLVSQSVEIERALIAMDAVMDGQIDKANELTNRDQQLFTQVATGVLRFIEATVSFEHESITAAVCALDKAEQMATKLKNNTQSIGLKTSSYRPTAVYELAEEECGLLSAISMLLTESKKEIIKALFKIRRTYMALEDLRKHVLAVNDEKKNKDSAELDYAVDSIGLDEFIKLHTERTKRSTKLPNKTPRETLDEYVQSGVEAMGGLLHLILSTLPPNFARLLSFVGLHGEREVALEMLWHAAEHYENIHGSLALIALVMFFDGQLQYRDIQLSPEEENKISEKLETGSLKSTPSKPKKITVKTTAKQSPRELRETRDHLMASLRTKRVYYPHGVLWLLLEGRIETHLDLEKGVKTLESTECGPNQMRQVEGLLVFDRTMFLLSLDRLYDAAESFIQLMDSSSWSHPLYMYLAASCYLELYRQYENPQSEEAKKYKDLATKWFLKAPTASGKKVLGRKMPFDGFVVRKVAHFQARAKETGKIDLCDGITTSPLYEALYFWNGQARMSPEVAARAVKRLQYSDSSINHSDTLKRAHENENEKFTRELLEATYSRRSSDSKHGYEMLKKLTEMVVTGDLNGSGNKKVSYHAQGEPWAGAACLYERAVYEWLQYGPSHAKDVRRWLDLSADWPDDYELSTRINIMLTGARDRLDIYRL